MQEVAGERGGYLHGRGALDSDDLLYLKEQMEAEEDAERLLRRTEKRAFAAFKKAASLADSSPASLPLPMRVEPKPKSGIRQQDLLKNIVEIRPKRQRVLSPSDVVQGDQSGPSLAAPSSLGKSENGSGRKSSSPRLSGDRRSPTLVARSLSPGTAQPSGEDLSSSRTSDEIGVKQESSVASILGLAYESSDED